MTALKAITLRIIGNLPLANSTFDNHKGPLKRSTFMVLCELPKLYFQGDLYEIL